MDILYLLKTEQEAVLQSLQKFQGSEEAPENLSRWFSALSRAVRRYLRIDRDFLYLEISEILPNARKLAVAGQQEHTKIEALLRLVSELLQKPGEKSTEIAAALSELCCQVGSHFRYQQEHVIPKMRELIPTQDREDLSEVFRDLLEEWARELPSGPLPEEALAPVPGNYA